MKGPVAPVFPVPICAIRLADSVPVGRRQSDRVWLPCWDVKSSAQAVAAHQLPTHRPSEVWKLRSSAAMVWAEPNEGVTTVPRSGPVYGFPVGLAVVPATLLVKVSPLDIQVTSETLS